MSHERFEPSPLPDTELEISDSQKITTELDDPEQTETLMPESTHTLTPDPKSDPYLMIESTYKRIEEPNPVLVGEELERYQKESEIEKAFSEKQIFERFGLNEKNLALSEREKFLRETFGRWWQKSPEERSGHVQTHESGSTSHKKKIQLPRVGSVLLKTRAGETEMLRYGMPRGRYFMQEHIASRLDQRLTFDQVPATALVALPGEARDENVGSIQEWKNAITFYHFGDIGFFGKGRNGTNHPETLEEFDKLTRLVKEKKRAGQDIDPELKTRYLQLSRTYLSSRGRKLYDMIRHDETMRLEFMQKAVSDIIMLSSDLCMHTNNVLIDPVQKKLYSIDNGLIFCNPYYYLNRGYSSFITEGMRGAEIPESILSKLRDFKEKLADGSLKEDLEPFFHTAHPGFEILQWMQCIIDKILEEKTVFSIRDLRRDSRFHAFLFPSTKESSAVHESSKFVQPLDPNQQPQQERERDQYTRFQ